MMQGSRLQANAQGARVWRPGSSALFLPEQSELRRLPRAALRPRPESFLERFEDRALFYDCFWHADGNRVLLAGPPPVNLWPHYQQAEFTALPSGERLVPGFHRSRSTMLTELRNVPRDTSVIGVRFDGESYDVPVQPNLSRELAGSRLMFTMNKDNELGWIQDWARYHALVHRADSVVIFDNGSRKYGLDELEAALAPTPGLKNLVLFDWPWRYGSADPSVLLNNFWPLFLQISSMSVVLRRLGAAAEAILNCDVDELVSPVSGGPIFDLTRSSQDGLVRLSGSWVESATPDGGPGGTHFDFPFVRRDFLRQACPPKWVLDPRQGWVEKLDTFAYMHRVKYPPSGRSPIHPDGHFWHFSGINSNWKAQRRRADRYSPLLHRTDPSLAATRMLYLELQRSGR